MLFFVIRDCLGVRLIATVVDTVGLCSSYHVRRVALCICSLLVAIVIQHND